MKRQFPNPDPEVAEAMFEAIAAVIDNHLGFVPKAFVLILTDGKQAQTLFAGNDPNDMTRLLTEGREQHLKHKRQ